MSKLASANLSARERVAGMEDLLQQILLRLPAKSLLRFKTVSKQWLSLISDPKFVQSHVLRNPSSPPSGMFVDIWKPWKIDFFPLGGGTNQAKPTFDFIDNVFCEIVIPYQEKPLEVSIFQSCNGLFLCRSFKNHHLCVCNPTTKQYRFIPQIESPSGERWKLSALGFAFDPSISPHYYVVCERYIEHWVSHSWTIRVDVYSSKDHLWRLLDLKESEQNAPDIDLGQDGIFYNGGIHCLGHHSFHFDLKSECLVQRPRPHWMHARVPRRSFPVIEAGIPFDAGIPDGFAQVRDRYLYRTAYQNEKLCVFEMSKDYRKWVVKYSLNFYHLTSAYPEILTTERFNGRTIRNVGTVNRSCRGFAACALGVLEGLNEEEAELLLAIPEKIISYNFVREEVKTVYDFPAEPAKKIDIRTFPFIETLSPV